MYFQGANIEFSIFSDQDEESRQTEVGVRVRILDQNDNDPKFYGYQKLQKLGNERQILSLVKGKCFNENSTQFGLLVAESTFNFF